MSQFSIYMASRPCKISAADALSYFGHLLVIRTPIWVNQSLMERGQQDLQLYNLTRPVTQPPDRAPDRAKCGRKLFLESYLWKVIFGSFSNCKLVDVKNRSHGSPGAWERFILDSQTTGGVDYQHIIGNHPNLAYLVSGLLFLCS